MLPIYNKNKMMIIKVIIFFIKTKKDQTSLT